MLPPSVETLFSDTSMTLLPSGTTLTLLEWPRSIRSFHFTPTGTGFQSYVGTVRWSASSLMTKTGPSQSIRTGGMLPSIEAHSGILSSPSSCPNEIRSHPPAPRVMATAKSSSTQTTGASGWAAGAEDWVDPRVLASTGGLARQSGPTFKRPCHPRPPRACIMAADCFHRGSPPCGDSFRPIRCPPLALRRAPILGVAPDRGSALVLDHPVAAHPQTRPFVRSPHRWPVRSRGRSDILPALGT